MAFTTAITKAELTAICCVSCADVPISSVNVQ